MKRALALAIISAALCGCSGNSAREALGLSREAPDEFRVVARPPLSVPPQFSLRPPTAPGEAEDLSAHKQAEALVLGAKQPSAGNIFILAPGGSETAVKPVEARDAPARVTPESNFLSRAGAGEANPNVRREIEEERAAVNAPVEESGWWNVLSTAPPKKDAAVNAKAEAMRIKKNQEEGKPVTEGATPEIKGRDTGILGRILDY